MALRQDIKWLVIERHPPLIAIEHPVGMDQTQISQWLWVYLLIIWLHGSYFRLLTNAIRSAFSIQRCSRRPYGSRHSWFHPAVHSDCLLVWAWLLKCSICTLITSIFLGVLVYDHLLTIPAEIQVGRRKNFSLSRFFYFAIRYTALINVLVRFPTVVRLGVLYSPRTWELCHVPQ